MIRFKGIIVVLAMLLYEWRLLVPQHYSALPDKRRQFHSCVLIRSHN